MAAQRTSFEKLQRDRAKKAKAAAKRERRLEKDARPADVEADEVRAEEPGGELSASELLEQVEAIHRRFDAKEITFEQFEEEKASLMARLPID